HFDRFDTPDDEVDGLWSLGFGTSPQGFVDRIVISLDEAEATFIRKPDASLEEPATLAQYVGKYVLAGQTVEIQLIDKILYLAAPGTPRIQLVPFRANQFRVKEFADLMINFVLENGHVRAFKQVDPSGEYQFERKQ
ncbi:MAG TPA: penicillin-binding protein, partial [Bacteroidota bacterium]|nr:penicillin-binding protein [Bacteroidota bacterium]